MSRWGLADPCRDPFLYALDPETEGEQLAPEELEQLVQAVARTHVSQTALGLGLLKVSDDELMPVPHRRVRVVDDQEKRFFAGAVITPFGPLDLDIEQAKALTALLPDPNLVRFVGLEESLLAGLLEDRTLVPGVRQRIGNFSLVGRDGLVVAPIDQIIDLGYQTDPI